MSDSQPPGAVKNQEDVKSEPTIDPCEHHLVEVLGGVFETGLPPGTVRLPNGILARGVLQDSAKGTWVQVREVSLDREDSKKRRVDYYDYRLGWILEGYKLAKDRAVEDIMSDTTTSIPKMPE